MPKRSSTLEYVEKCLTGASAALWRASRASETLNDEGLTDDLLGLTYAVGSLLDGLVNNRLSRKAQLHLPESCAYPPTRVRDSSG